MAALALTAPRDLLIQLTAEPSVTVSIVRTTAVENDDGTWTLIVYAPEDQVPRSNRSVTPCRWWRAMRRCSPAGRRSRSTSHPSPEHLNAWRRPPCPATCAPPT
jgi:hypothetical protein